MINLDKMKKLLLITLVSIVVGCNQKPDDAKSVIEQEPKAEYNPNPEAIELNNKALEMTMFNRDDLAKVDSAIMLLDKATELDPQYFLGYSNKVQFLMIKKDFSRLLETNQRIRELRPNHPNWIIQHAMILELSGKIDKANAVYKKGISVYEKLNSSEKNQSWEFELEFAQSLVIANDYDKALEIILRLKKEHPDLKIWETFVLQTKEELLKLMK